MSKSYLFGYGTLRSDISKSSNAIEMYNAKSLGFGWVEGELWQIENSYGVWAGVKEANNSKVYGEIFEVNDKILELTDYREQTIPHSNPPYYIRKLVNATLTNGQELKVFIYLAGQERTKWIKFVKYGDWKEFLDKL